MSVLAMRLREARLSAGLSQEQLGVLAGLDETSAKTRISRYETGDRMPDPELVERIGEALGVPTPFFYARDDDMAHLLAVFGGLRPKDRARVVEFAAGFSH